jgi:hypothetical protein
VSDQAKRVSALRGPNGIAITSASERAAIRRATWTGGVARSFREADEQDVEYWLAATPEQRIRAVTELTAEMLAMEGVREPSLRLQRSVGGTRPRRC